MTSQMPEQLQQLKESFASLKGAKNPTAAAQVLTDVQAQMSGFMQSVKTAFQKK